MKMGRAEGKTVWGKRGNPWSSSGAMIFIND